jgi:hypothetical protein
MVGYSKDPNDTPLFLSELPKNLLMLKTDSELTMFDQNGATQILLYLQTVCLFVDDFPMTVGISSIG